MPECRRDDAESRTWFRSSRLFRQETLWYFSTREGTVEGPFADDAMANDKLEAYKHHMTPRSAAAQEDFPKRRPRDKRNRKDRVPRDLNRVLSDLQLLGLKAVEGFGWAVAFVRRPMFEDAVVVVTSPDGKQLGVLDDDGNINLNAELMLRH